MDAVADAVVNNLTMWVRDPVILHDYTHHGTHLTNHEADLNI